MHTCHHCREPFDAVRWDARFCSAKCRAAASRERQKAEIEALRAALAAKP
jgi:predicted nucleic acid-binding Zn ribbon protein